MVQVVFLTINIKCGLAWQHDIDDLLHRAGETLDRNPKYSEVLLGGNAKLSIFDMMRDANGCI